MMTRITRLPAVRAFAPTAFRRALRAAHVVRAAALPLAGATLLFTPLLAQAQAQTPTAATGVMAARGNASLDGTVSDAARHLMPGAHVDLLDTQGRVLASTVAGSKGQFYFGGLQAGDYRVSATHDGVQLGSATVHVAAGTQAHAGTLKPAEAAELGAVAVTGRFAPRPRNALSPSTGSSQYQFDAKSIAALPQGENSSINEVLLQAPGVVNDSLGQLHVRGDHGDLQYRINGIILPEGVSGFGQTLDTRFVSKMDLLTGALPAQYGYRTAGVIDITTKQHFDGGEVSLYGGSHGEINPSIEYGGSKGPFTGYVTAQYLSSSLGIENTTSGANAIHDRTTQGKAFAYLSYQLAPDLKLAGMFGSAVSRYEIPNTPGVSPDADYLAAAGISGFDSTQLNERQYERNNYGILALQGVTAGDARWQVAAFDRVSSVNYQPDPVGDLVFSGDASTILRKSSTLGLQGDVAVPIGDQHTVRAGVFGSTEDDRADNTSTVFCTYPQSAPANAACPAAPVSGDLSGPVTIVDNNPRNGNTLLGLYLQDEWDISDQLTVNYGVRYDYLAAYVTAQQLSPRLGVVWMPTSKTTVHAAYARYFTPPPNELISNSSITAFNGTTNAQVGANSPVQPERDHYFDVGVAQQFTRELNIGVDGFYKYARNLMDEGQFGQALIYAPFNYGQGHIYGVELSSVYHRGGFNAYLNLAHTIAQATNVVSGQFNFSPEDLAFIAQHYIYLDHDQHLTLSGGTSYDWRKTTFGMDFTYGSGLRNDGDGSVPNGGKEPSNLQVNLSAARTVNLGQFGPLKLRVAALNVLDRSNQIHDGTGIGVQTAQYGPRAAVYFGIAKPF